MAVTVGELEAKLHADVSSFVAGMRQASNAFQQTQRTIGQGSSNLNQFTTSLNSVQNAVGKLGNKMNLVFASIGAGFILPQVFGAAKSAVIDFNQQVDQATVALTNFLGSSTEAKKMIGDLQDFAARTPFQFKDLLGTTQSMMAMGVAADEVLPRMQAIGDAAAAMGGSPEVLYRIQRALGQIQAKGRVQSEELLQLAEAGIPAYQYMADALGTTTADMLNDMRKGTVDSATAITAILDGMARDFGGMMEEQSKTMMGAMSTVMDYVQMTVGAIFRPVFETLRDAFVKISEILSDKTMQSAAQNFAKGIATVINSIKSMIAAFATNLKKPVVDIAQALGNMIQVALRLASALKPMVMGIVAPLAVAFTAIVTAVAPLIRMLTSLAEVVTRNQVVLYALAGLLMGKMLLGFKQNGTAANMFGNVVNKTFSAMGKHFATARNNFNMLRGYGVSTFEALKASMSATAAGFKAMGAAIMSSLASLLPMMVAFMALGKVMEAFSNRNKDAKARAEELTVAIKEQTDAILANENALTALNNAGLTPLNEALAKTGKEGEETTNALISLGRSADDYLSTMIEFRKSTYDSAYALAKAKGFTDEQAQAIAKYVKTQDKGTDAQHRSRMEYMQFTPAMIAATMSIEQLDDASENTNIPKMTQQMIEASVRANEATQRFYEQAQAIVAKKVATDSSITADQQAIMVLEEYTKLSAEYEKKTNDAANANKEMAQATETAYDRVKRLIAGMKDGKLEAADFARELLGVARYAQINAKRAFFDMGVALNGYLKGLKETKGNSNALLSSAYDLSDMMSQNSATIIQLGGSLGDVDAAIKQTVSAFLEQGRAAGWSNDRLLAVLRTVGILNENDTIVLTIDVDTKRLQEMLRILSGMGGADALAYNEIAKKLAELNNEKKRSLNLDLTSIDASNKAASGAAKATEASKKLQERLDKLRQRISDTYETAIDRAKTNLDELANKHDDLSNSIADVIKSYVSMTNAFSEATSAQDELDTAAQNAADAQTQLSMVMNRLKNPVEGVSVSLSDYISAVTNATKADEALGKAQKKNTNFLDVLKGKYEAAVNFGDMLKKLKDAGLNEAGIRQVAAAGVEDGMKIGQALLDGASDGVINNANTWFSTLESTANQVGLDVSDNFYKSGVDSAQAFYDGLVAHWEKLKPTLPDMKLPELQKTLSEAQGTIEKIAAAPTMESTTGFSTNEQFASWLMGTPEIVRTVKSPKKPKKPKIPKLADGGIVNRATLALIGESGPEAVMPLKSSMVGGSGDTINIVVNAGMGTDGKSVGQAIIDELVTYQRRVGVLPLKIQGMK